MAVAGALALAAVVMPVKLCPMAIMFHLPCPGCGMTRAVVAILRGDYRQTMALHPVSFAVLPFAVWLLATHVVGYVRTGKPWSTGRVPRATEALAAALVGLLFVVWAARFFGLFGGPVTV